MSEKILNRKPTALEHLYCNNCIGKNTCDHNAAVRCPSHFDRFFTGYKLGEQHTKERAIEAFCDEMNKESVMCKLSKQCDMACRDTCPAYESFINALNF